MAHNVCFLFGINGVGKSTLARTLAASIPGTVTINASETLRAVLGGIEREDLERIDPERKHALLNRALTDDFRVHAAAPLIVCDTHLVVTIRSGSGAHREHMWDASLEPFLRLAVYVTAPLELIRERRERDAARTGRVRPLSMEAIAEDELLNRLAFQAIFAADPRARTLENLDLPHTTAARVKRLLSA